MPRHRVKVACWRSCMSIRWAARSHAASALRSRQARCRMVLRSGFSNRCSSLPEAGAGGFLGRGPLSTSTFVSASLQLRRNRCGAQRAPSTAGGRHQSHPSRPTGSRCSRMRARGPVVGPPWPQRASHTRGWLMSPLASVRVAWARCRGPRTMVRGPARARLVDGSPWAALVPRSLFHRDSPTPSPPPWRTPRGTALLEDGACTSRTLCRQGAGIKRSPLARRRTFLRDGPPLRPAPPAAASLARNPGRSRGLGASATQTADCTREGRISVASRRASSPTTVPLNPSGHGPERRLIQVAALPALGHGVPLPPWPAGRRPTPAALAHLRRGYEPAHVATEHAIQQGPVRYRLIAAWAAWTPCWGRRGPFHTFAANARTTACLAAAPEFFDMVPDCPVAHEAVDRGVAWSPCGTPPPTGSVPDSGARWADPL